MADKNYSFKFTESQVGNGRTVLRPLLGVTVFGPKRQLETVFLVDSGADASLIPVELATALGYDVRALPQDKTTGVGGSITVAKTDLKFEFGDGASKITSTVPVHIPIDQPDGATCMSLLGREGFFYDFDIHFRMGYAQTKGKFVISKARHRKDNRYA